MALYKKKPVTIDAYQWFEGQESSDVIPLDKKIKYLDFEFVGKIKTIEDTDDSVHYVRSSDWIITGVKGEKYAYKDDIFKETYTKFRIRKQK